MKKQIYFNILISLAVFCYAQQEVYLSAERISVTAKKYEQPTENSSLSVSVVTKDDIELTNVYQTTDILNLLPGIFVTRTSAFGRADVNIRGIGNNGRQLGIFIDGRPDKMALMGCSVTHTLPLNNVERIEVIRGPESVIYGSEAFGGVVNIITKKAKKDLEGSLNLYGGSFNTQISKFQIGRDLGRLNWLFSVDRRYSDGHTESSQYKATDFGGNIGYMFSKNFELSFSGKYFDGIKYEPFPAASGTWNDYKRGSTDLNLKTNLGFANLTTKIYRTFGEHKFSDGWHSQDYTNGVVINGNSNLLENNILSYGVDYRYFWGKVLSGAPAAFLNKDYTKYEYGVYIDDAHTFFSRLTVNAGVRYNYDEYAKEAVTPRFGLVYKLFNTITLRALYSQGFRPPHLNDLFLYASANPELKPERVTNIEFGVRQKIFNFMNIDLTAFNMKGKDLIQVVSGKKQNIGDFDFNGFEVLFNLKVIEGLGSSLSYSYLDTKDKVIAQPKNKLVAMINFKKGKISGLLTDEYVNEYYYLQGTTKTKLDDYNVLNLKLNYEIIKNLSIYATIDNITDAEYKIYTEVPGASDVYTMPKRTFGLGVNYLF